MQTYVRWRLGDPRVTRVFPPLKADHPGYHDPCIACGGQLGNGTPVQIIVLGPGADTEDRERHHAGRWYSAAAWVLHADCLGTKRASEEIEPDDAGALEWRDV